MKKLKEQPGGFEATDLQLMPTLRRRLHNTYASSRTVDLLLYAADAELIWSCRNYLMVRTGSHQGQREVVLFSRQKLILDRGNPDKNGMLEIAIAQIDDVHKTWTGNFSFVLWRSGKWGGGVEECRHLRGVRWGKKLLNSLIAYAKTLDNTVEERLTDYLAGRKRERNFAKEVVSVLGKKEIPIVMSSNDRPPGQILPNRVYAVRLPGSDTSDAKFRFRPKRSEEIEIQWKLVNLSPDEFEILAEAVARIHRLRETQHPVTQKPVKKKVARKRARV